MPFTQVVIDDSTSKIITGHHEWDRTNGGVFVGPADTVEPGSPEVGEWFWNITSNVLVRWSGSAWVPVSITPSSIDHGGLAGLGDDDHTQYQLRSEKGVANGYAGLDVSGEIGDAAHGNRSGGTLHQVVTLTTAGFMSAMDKVKLDGIPSGATDDHGALNGLADDDHTQYHTDGRALTWLGTRSTTDLPEGTNLYYTEVRVSANADVAANTVHRGNTSNPHNVTPAQIGAIPTTEKGAANGVATLDAGSKIPVAQIPAVALPEVHVVADTAARLALTVQEGDEAIQLDDGSHWIYDGSAWHQRPSGSGISGPSSSTDNALVRWDGTTGSVVQDSGVTLDDSDNMTVPGTINTIRHYGKSATNPSSPTPADGDIYWNTALGEEMRYDGTRGKWLSTTTLTLQAGRNGYTYSGQFYRLINGMSMDATNGGVPVPKGTIVGLAMTRSDADSATLEIGLNGSVVTTLLSNSSGLTADWTKNADIAEGILSAKNQSGSNITTRVQITVLIKRRV